MSDNKKENITSLKKRDIINRGKLQVYDWLGDVPATGRRKNLIEVRFKNTRKDYFINSNNLNLKVDDYVAVEAASGHDIGIVSLTGELVFEQLRKNGINHRETEFKKVYRLAKPADLEKREAAIALEHSTMIKARQIAADLNLEMKIGDVEYQGDKTKAIFYYIADERVDFRELIKILAETFKIRIEMRQIGARQEAGRIGGIGSCGRPLCCANHMSNFVSVTTTAAKYQEISLNPQKLAGLCAKLKCCLNYEVDSYIDAQEGFPNTEITLFTKEGEAFHQKTDIYKKLMWYSYDKAESISMVELPIERVKEIIRLNKKNIKPDKLIEIDYNKEAQKLEFSKVVGQDDLNRFDKSNNKGNKRNSLHRRKKRNIKNRTSKRDN